MFTSSSPKQCMLSGGPINFGQGCPHTLLSNMYWRGAWRRVGVLREGEALQKHSDLFGICQDLPALKWTMRCSNCYQSHIRVVNNTKTYHRQGKQGALLIQKSWWHSLDGDIHLMQIPHFGTSRPESQSYNYWYTCGNRCRRWRCPDRPCSSIPTAHYLMISGKWSGQCSDPWTL